MGCRPASVVTVRLDGVRLAKTRAEADTSIPGVVGFFVADLTIPANTPAGDHNTLVASCPAPHGVGSYLKQQRVTITVVCS